MDEIVRVARELKYSGAIVDFYQDDMQMPGGHIAKWDVIVHRMGAAAVLPVLPNGKILMVRQQRPAIGRKTLEIPAGAKDDRREEALACAMRELEEETGYRAGRIEPLVKIATTPAFCDEVLEIFLAKNLVPTIQHLDEDEFLDVEEWELDDLINGILCGDIVDGKTVAAILAYHAKTAS